uniref:BPTI/Kunitz inhibitor domain-containing protein n=1 Tax=Meloidogyne enterolobii TaxID=390850 RepID=A0A6V7WM78_MELEN|nr:unnamed protein product [Meloidogyne enterolobii]
MRNFFILLLLLTAFVEISQSASKFCFQPLRKGHGGKRCKAVMRWWYDSNARKCKRFKYLGCGGSSNRWFNKAECRKECMS